MSENAVPTGATAHGSTAASARTWWGAAMLLAATALSLLTSTIVNVALPSMQRDLALSPSGIAWVMAGWALAYALPLVPAGRLGDRIGHKRVFITGVLLFALASIACALAQNELQLVIFRILQGLAGGVFYPAVAAMFGAQFHGRERARAFAIMGAVIGVAAAIGPLLGGLILQAAPAELGWRLVFLSGIPIAVVVIVGAIPLLRDTPPMPGARRSDTVGLLLLSAGLSGVLIPLIVGEQQQWPLWGWVLLGGGLVLLAVFLGWEERLDRRGGLALIPPRLLRLPGVGLPVVISLMQFAGFIAIFYILALLWETGLGRTPLEMGVLTLPEAVGAILGSWAVPRLFDRFGVHTVAIGSGLLAIGVIGIWFALVMAPPAELSIWVLALPLFVTGVGTGTTISPTLNHAISSVPSGETGSASGIIATVQRLGNAAGLAAVGAVFFALLPSVADAEGYVHAATGGLLLCAIFTVVGFAFALALSATSRSDRTLNGIGHNPESGSHLMR